MISLTKLCASSSQSPYHLFHFKALLLLVQLKCFVHSAIEVTCSLELLLKSDLDECESVPYKNVLQLNKGWEMSHATSGENEKKHTC